MHAVNPYLNPEQARRRALLSRGVALAVAGPVLPAVPLAAPAEPRRLISVGGSLTEIVHAIGAQGQLVAVDSTSDRRAVDGSLLPDVGYSRSLSAEGLLALRPDRVLTTQEAGPPHVLERLRQAGVSVVSVTAEPTVPAARERIAAVGHACHRQTQAAALQARFDQQWRATQHVIGQQAGPRPRVLFLLAHASRQQIMVSGRGTAAHAMIELAGGQSALGEAFEGYRPITPEAVLLARPDVLLVTDQGLNAQGGIESLLALPGMARTVAGRERRIISREAVALLGFGYRLPEVVASLHRALYQGIAA
jgi:iron complex transport system substrate-binding protein